MAGSAAELSAANQRVSQAAGRRSFASAAGTCRKVPPVAARARPAAVPARQCSRHPAPEHQPVVHHEGLAGPGGWWQQLQSYPSRCWARRGGSSMCPDRLILYTKCALMCLQGLSGQNHVGIPVRAHRGCALTCALKNRAYGASVPAGGVCLQGQFDGNRKYASGTRSF